jgi:magnesium chelatase family protein
MIGTPGSRKPMLSKRLPTKLPPLTPAKCLDTTRIYSATGLLPPVQALLSVRPFRNSHHKFSDPEMVGGSTVPQSREISPAHHGAK